jgi:isoquinoline 1-oxidoreductase beta subunit
MGLPYKPTGDAEAAIANAARVLRGEFRTRYVCHAAMEPLNATAMVSPDGKSAQICAGTQPPTNVLSQVSFEHHVPPARSRRPFRAPRLGAGCRA